MSRLGLIFLFTVHAVVATAGNWPAWRGPDGSGISREKKVPIHWSTNQNVAWSTPLPDRGNSTPIVWERRIFVTQAIATENRRTVICFDRDNGRQLWQSGVTVTTNEPTHDTNPHCAPSPVTDGKRVIAWFGSAGVYCYDLNGREIWHRELGPQKHIWGYGSSPMLHGDLCILHFGPGERTFVIALNKKTGETVWKQDLVTVPPGAQWKDYAGDTPYSDGPGAMKLSEVAGSWATPLAVRASGRDEVIIAAPVRLLALSTKTGGQLWICQGPNIGIYSSPFFGDGRIILASSGMQNSLMSVRPGGLGDVTPSHRDWFRPEGNSKGTVGSGVVYEKRIYKVSNNGFVDCADLATGKMLWEERLTGRGARNGSSSSPVVAGGHLYLANHNAEVFVLRPGPRFDCIATNSIGGEPMNASLAFSDGAIFLRTDKHLWCIKEK